MTPTESSPHAPPPAKGEGEALGPQAGGVPFFERVTRFLPWNINPRENRLTEITASTEQPLRAFGEAASYRAWFGQLQERHGAADFALANLDRQGRAVMIAPVGQLLASADSGGHEAAAARPVDDIEQQAERLARWVDAAFRTIEASDYPR